MTTLSRAKRGCRCTPICRIFGGLVAVAAVLVLLPSIALATTYTNPTTGQQSPGEVPEVSPGAPIGVNGVPIVDPANPYKATVLPYGELTVAVEPANKFQDTFESGVRDTVNWNAPVAAGGGVLATWTAGNLSIATGPTAAGYSYLTSAPKFRPVQPGYIRTGIAVNLPAVIPTNTYMAWGTFTPTATPTTASPIQEGCAFEIQPGGKEYIACYAGAVRTVIIDMSAGTGTGMQPTDGKTHLFVQDFRGDLMAWYLGSYTAGSKDQIMLTPLATQQSGANGPNINTQPLGILAIGGPGTPGSSLVANIAATWVGLTNANSWICDATYSFQCVSVSAAGALAAQMVDATGANKALVATDGSLLVTPLGSKLFYDGYETSFDTTNLWNAPTSAGGGVGEAFCAGGGCITLGTGTTANGYSYVQSQTSFQPNPPAFNLFEDAIQVPSVIPANTEAFWGFGTSPATPTAAIPITEGCGFEIQTGGKMFAVCFAGSTRNNIQDLSAATGSGKQPTDGATHVYFVKFRGDNYQFMIDSYTNVVASQATGVNGPNINTQPLKIQAVAGTTNPVSSLTITAASVWVGDLGKNSGKNCDSTYQYRCQAVNKAGGAAMFVGPTAETVAGITPGIAGSAASGVVLKASAGNLYGVYATAGATALWLMVFNSVTVPSNGATTAGIASGNMQDCVPVPTNGSSSITYSGIPPEIFTVGISAAVSSTACGTLTLSTTGFIHGSVQ